MREKNIKINKEISYTNFDNEVVLPGDKDNDPGDFSERSDQ